MGAYFFYKALFILLFEGQVPLDESDLALAVDQQKQRYHVQSLF